MQHNKFNHLGVHRRYIVRLSLSNGSRVAVSAPRLLSCITTRRSPHCGHHCIWAVRGGSLRSCGHSEVAGVVVADLAAVGVAAATEEGMEYPRNHLVLD